jgi:hypothetical protein
MSGCGFPFLTTCLNPAGADNKYTKGITHLTDFNVSILHQQMKGAEIIKQAVFSSSKDSV